MGVRVSRFDSNWNCFTTLLEICRLVFLESITSLQLLQLESLVEEFLTTFKACYNRKLTLKMHHMTHLARHIRSFGPLCAVWCMRYEAKHSYFKQLQRRIRNFKNMPFTLSLRHQQWHCEQFRSAYDELLKVHISSPKGSRVLLSNKKYAGQVAGYFALERISMFIQCFKWIKVGSTKFKVNESVIICPLIGSVAGQFGLIVDIVKYQDNFLFVCKLYRTVKFYNHIQSFRLEKRKDDLYMIQSPRELVDFHVYACHVPGFFRPISDDDVFITTKSDVSKYIT